MLRRCAPRNDGETRRWAYAVLSALVLLAAPAHAVEPDEILADPKLEARARDISAGLRCLVCQNQSIDDSEASLARDLRLIVRERLTAGDTDDQARAFLVARYGPYILLKPPLGWGTLLLWGAPALCLIGGGAAMALAGARRRREEGPASAPLDAHEQAALERIVGGERQ